MQSRARTLFAVNRNPHRCDGMSSLQYDRDRNHLRFLYSSAPTACPNALGVCTAEIAERASLHRSCHREPYACQSVLGANSNGVAWNRRDSIAVDQNLKAFATAQHLPCRSERLVQRTSTTWWCRRCSLPPGSLAGWRLRVPDAF